VINPAVGYSFNKSIVVEDTSTGELYYLIPLLLGNGSWSSGVLEAGYTVDSANFTLTLYDCNYNPCKVVDSIVASYGYNYLFADVYMRYIDGRERYLTRIFLGESKTIYVNTTPGGSWVTRGFFILEKSYFDVLLAVEPDMLVMGRSGL